MSVGLALERLAGTPHEDGWAVFTARGRIERIEWDDDYLGRAVPTDAEIATAEADVDIDQAASAKSAQNAETYAAVMSAGLTVEVNQQRYTFDATKSDVESLRDALLGATALAGAGIAAMGIPLFPRGHSEPLPGSADDGLLTGKEALAFLLPLTGMISALEAKRISINRRIAAAKSVADVDAVSIDYGA